MGELEEWVKTVKDQILDAKVVSIESQDDDSVYKFTLVSSDFYDFNNILWKVAERYRKSPCRFVTEYNLHLNKVLAYLNKKYKTSIHLVDTHIVDNYTAIHLGQPKVTMYCYIDLPKQNGKVIHSSSECYVKVHNYEENYNRTITLRELIRLITDSEDSKINELWREQELLKVMEERLENWRD